MTNNIYMKERIEKIAAEIEQAKAVTQDEIEQFRIKYLGSKGQIKELFTAFKEVSREQKALYGQQLNVLKQKAQTKLDVLKSNSQRTVEAANQPNDLSRPGIESPSGSIQPITLVQRQINQSFQNIGFSIEEGPEIEDDWHNFSSLNFPEEHPARDKQDTFFVKVGEENKVLRTHTSSVQIRVMENNQPPIRVISPGRVYRNEAISARAHCFFHQVEGLYIDKNVTFADLKQTLLYFVHSFFGENANIRLRPSYFPFTEPSAEMDVSCTICNGKGCNVCKYTGWLEIMGCGMVDPNVLENCGIDPTVYSGFAFGMGVEKKSES